MPSTVPHALRHVIGQRQRRTRCLRPEPLKRRHERWEIIRLQPRKPQVLDRFVELAALRLNMPGVAEGRRAAPA
jgi:hypothetical protein